jgi:hypothetical protein
VTEADHPCLVEKIMSKATMRNLEARPNVRELREHELEHVSGGRPMPNGKTDVIKVMGNRKWGDIELQPA